jgi:ADP-heptose:LPS heptosyltransferase
MKDAQLNSSDKPSSIAPHHSSIFVLRAGAIGDFILTLPALYAVRQKYPSHHLILAARADVLPLVRDTLADTTIAFDSALLTPLFASDATPSDELTRLLTGIDLAVLWLAENSARVVANHLRRLDAQRLLMANPLPTARHAADHLLDSLAPIGIVSGSRIPVLPLRAETRSLADDFWRMHSFTARTRVIALHIGSGSEPKRWPLENFLALAHQLALLAGVRVLLIHGPAERHWIRPIAKISPAITQLDSPDLSRLASILARCSLYIGNDSGITHLAAALGTPAIALFGPTDPAIWGPRGEYVSIIRSPTTRMGDLTIESVWQAVHDRLPMDDR